MTKPCVLAVGEKSCELRIIRRVSKAEVGLVARFCGLVSSDKLVEALSSPMITQLDYDVIEAELLRRLHRQSGED